MTYEIEKNVPIPVAGLKKTGISAKLRQLEVGESIFVPGRKPADVSGFITWARVGNLKEFKSRTIEGGVRIWRIS